MGIRTRKPAVAKAYYEEWRAVLGLAEQYRLGAQIGGSGPLVRDMIDPAAIHTYCEMVFRNPPPGGRIALPTLVAERVTMLCGLAASLFGADNMFGAGRAHQPIRIAGSVHRKAEPVPVEIAYTSPSVLDVEEAERRLVSVSAPRPTVSGGRMLTYSHFAKPETNEGRVITEPWSTFAERLIAHEVVGYDADPGLTGTQREGISKIMLSTGLNGAEP